MILFCLPYAGGSESIYYEWKKYLSSSIRLNPIELKGRGRRYNEPFYETLDEAVEDIFKNIKYKIMDDDYAIYGHSMGSLLAYELYYKIKKYNVKEPKHIFFSGYQAPSVIGKKEDIHNLPDYDFIKKMIDIGGTPKEIVNNMEIFEIFIPILRSDFKIIENYNYEKKEKKIECDVSILCGKQDFLQLKEILAWKDHVAKEIKIYNFEGNHFFINDNIQVITNVINDILTI